MLNNIRVYNVGFGDCSLLMGKNEEEVYNILVDCGTIAGKAQADSVVNSLKGYYSNHKNGKNIGVLTHFHRDHSSRFSSFQGVFDEFYLPGFFSEEEIELQLYILLIQQVYSPLHRFAYQLLKSINLTDNVIKGRGTVCFVKEGREIIDGITVLWPQKNLHKIVRETVESIKNMVNVEFQESLPEAQKLIETIKDKMLKLAEYNENRGGFEIRNNESTISEIEQINTLISQLKNMRDFVIKLDKENMKKVKEIQHNYSLVFSKIDEDEKKILFLGDIDKNCYEKCLAEKVKCEHPYHVVKIAHHGTNSHFTKELPKAKKMIVSNGNRKRSYISEKYIIQYPETEFVCTNRSECEFWISTNESCEKDKKALCRATKEKGLHCGFGDDIYRDIL